MSCKECERAKNYAKMLAETLYKQYYKDDSPNWEPLDTTTGLLTQIDNMVSGMEKKIDPTKNTVEVDWNFFNDIRLRLLELSTNDTQENDDFNDEEADCDMMDKMEEILDTRRSNFN